MQRVEEKNRRSFVDLGDHVQEHGGIGAEARDKRDPPGEQIFDDEAQQFLGPQRQIPVREARGRDLIADQRCLKALIESFLEGATPTRR